MALAYINISATQYFNFMCRTDFERRIYHDTYKAFQDKSSPYSLNNTVHTFENMQFANCDAKLLHAQLNLSIADSLASLHNKIPVLFDANGQSILFSSANLQIISSDLKNKAAHVVSIIYTSLNLILHEIVSDLLILSYDIPGAFNKTFMVKLTDDLVINHRTKAQLIPN